MEFELVQIYSGVTMNWYSVGLNGRKLGVLYHEFTKDIYWASSSYSISPPLTKNKAICWLVNEANKHYVPTLQVEQTAE